MKLIRKCAVALLLTLMTTTTSTFAADDTIREVFTDAFYGAGIGGMLGGAMMVFTKKPVDHIDRIAYGAASGVIIGTAYGLFKSARAFAEIEHGRITIAFPTILPELVVSPSSGRTAVAWKADLIHGTFF